MGERFFNATIFYLPEKLNFGNLRGLLWINNKCGLAFEKGGNAEVVSFLVHLRRHIMSYHIIHKGTTISCPRCEYETPLMFALRGHIKANHLRLKYECDICGHKGNAKESLKTHKNDEH